ncbi:MAG: hypothetical protein PHC51_03045 [bacterium]|nr:hypothetical protein [bacterium]
MNIIKFFVVCLALTATNSWATDVSQVNFTVPGREKQVVIGAAKVSDLVAKMTARFKTMTEVEFYTYTGLSLGLFSGIPQDLLNNNDNKTCSFPITVISSKFSSGRAFSNIYCGTLTTDVTGAEKHAEEELQLMVITAVAETGSPASISFFIPAMESRITMTALPVGNLDENNCRVVSSGYVVESYEIKGEMTQKQFETICLEQVEEKATNTKDGDDSFWSFNWFD